MRWWPATATPFPACWRLSGSSTCVRSPFLWTRTTAAGFGRTRCITTGCWRLGRGFGLGFGRRCPRRRSVRRVWGGDCRSVRWEVRGGGLGARCFGVCSAWMGLRARSVGRGCSFGRWCCLRRRFGFWRRQVGLRGVRHRGWGGAGCLKRGSRRAESALSQARRGVVFELEGRAGGVISGGWCAAGGRRVVGWPSLGSVR